jgi:GLPGLI family protein
MTKAIFFFTVLLFSSSLFAQSGQAVYVVKMNPLSYPNAGKFKERIEKMKEYANNQSFELQFNKDKSSFIYMEKLNSDQTFSEVENKIARSAFTSSFNYYFDLEGSREIRQTNENILIEKKDAQINWIISTETKEIGDYLCYKATYQEAYISSKSGKKQYNSVVAWFAPMLPYRYGPIQFHGLPGLILELQYINTTYFATNIKLSNDAINIKFPSGKTVTEEEYDRKLESTMGGVILRKKRD